MPTCEIIERSHVVIKTISQRVIQAHQITTDVKLLRVCLQSSIETLKQFKEAAQRDACLFCLEIFPGFHGGRGAYHICSADKTASVLP